MDSEYIYNLFYYITNNRMEENIGGLHSKQDYTNITFMFWTTNVFSGKMHDET